MSNRLRTSNKLLVLLVIASTGCAAEMSPDEPQADELSAELLPTGNNPGDFQVALVGVDYASDGHVYKSDPVGTPTLVNIPTNPTWSAWTQMPHANEQVTGLRISLLLNANSIPLSHQADFKICLQGKYTIINGSEGTAVCTPWASDIGSSCVQTRTGVGCEGYGFSDFAKTSSPDIWTPNSYRIGLMVRPWGNTKRAVYNFAFGGEAEGKNPNANCNDPLFGCYGYGTDAWTPSTSDFGGGSHTIALDNNQTNLFLTGIQIGIHTWYADNP